MTRAFVTGGTGSVGANLVAALNDRGIKVKVLLRASSSTKALEGLEYDPVAGDILDPVDSLAEAMSGCSWVFHVAAVSDYWRQDTKKLYKVNVDGTRNILAAAKLANVSRFVFTSSLISLGIPANGQLIDENHYFNLEPKQFPYAHSKYLAEMEVEKAIAAGLAAVIVNPGICIGARDVYMNSGSIVVEAARGLARVVLPGGNNMVALEDVAYGHIAAAERGRLGERYILGGTNISNAQALEVVCEVVDRPVPKIKLREWMLPLVAVLVDAGRAIFGNRIPFDSTQVRLLSETVYASSEKAINELGLPSTPYKTAVQDAYEWYLANGYLTRPK